MKEKYILATDLDGTLVGNTSAVQELFQYFNKRHTKLKLVYITGRHITSALQLIRKEKLPTPNILICDLGSSIYLQSGTDEFIEDKEWKKKMNTNWSPSSVIRVVKKLGLQLQSGISHTKRISLHVTCEQEIKDLFHALIQRNIAHNGIYSSGKGLDILPENSGKGEALTFVSQVHIPV